MRVVGDLSDCELVNHWRVDPDGHCISRPVWRNAAWLVAAGIGVSLVPASVAHLALDGVTYRPLHGAPDTELLAVTRAGEESPLARAFLAEAQATA